ncbi:MAG: helix-turn-helix domain-containing protein [Bacteriovoracia bacterium]
MGRNQNLKTEGKGSEIKIQSESKLKLIKTEVRQKLDADPTLLHNEWMDAFEVATYMGISYGSVRNMTYRREIPFYRLGRRLRFKTEEIRQHLSMSKVGIKEWGPCR